MVSESAATHWMVPLRSMHVEPVAHTLVLVQSVWLHAPPMGTGVTHMLPQIRTWLAELNRQREAMQRFETRLSGLTEAGVDVGGDTVNSWIRSLAAMQEVLAEFLQGGSMEGASAVDSRGEARRLDADPIADRDPDESRSIGG